MPYNLFFVNRVFCSSAEPTAGEPAAALDSYRSPRGTFCRFAAGDVPLFGAGDFGLGPKVTKGPPEPLWFRSSGFYRRVMRNIRRSESFVSCFSHHKPSSASSPAGPRHARLRNLFALAADELRRSCAALCRSLVDENRSTPPHHELQSDSAATINKSVSLAVRGPAGEVG